MNRANCGTNSGFMSHYRRGETPCDECAEARREYGRKRYAAKRKPNIGQCVVCAAPLTGQQKLLCSTKCQQKRNNSSAAFKAARARYRAGKGRETALKDHACEWCGSAFQSTSPKSRFCSYPCRDIVRYGSVKAVYFERCLECDSVFASQSANVIACSMSCHVKLDSKTRPPKPRYEWRTERECPGCACKFTPLYTPNSITCSKRCSRRVHRWRRKAAEQNATGAFTWSEFMRIARRFDYSCAYCGERDGQLEPDHVVPLSRGGSNSTTNLLPACRPCNADKSANLLPEWAAQRERLGKAPRATNWAPEDRRYWHLMLPRQAVAA